MLQSRIFCNGIKEGKDKKRKPIREESFLAELVFQKNDFSYIDSMVDPNRGKRAGPKGYLKACRHEKSKDMDASWGYDHHRERYVYGYKVHVLLDSETALPMMLTITTAGYGENKTV